MSGRLQHMWEGEARRARRLRHAETAPAAAVSCQASCSRFDVQPPASRTRAHTRTPHRWCRGRWQPPGGSPAAGTRRWPRARRTVGRWQKCSAQRTQTGCTGLRAARHTWARQSAAWCLQVSGGQANSQRSRRTGAPPALPLSCLSTRLPPAPSARTPALGVGQVGGGGGLQHRGVHACRRGAGAGVCIS